MRLSTILIYLLLLLPAHLFAQDTTAFKKQAARFVEATFNNDHETVIELTYPALVELSGGRLLMQKLITDKIEALHKRGIKKFEGSVGSPGKFYHAGDQIHCLIPESVVFRMATGHYTGRSYILGISNDKGKTWSFLDVGSMPPNILYTLLPNFNKNLEIPASGQPMYFPD